MGRQTYIESHPPNSTSALSHIYGVASGRIGDNGKRFGGEANRGAKGVRRFACFDVRGFEGGAVEGMAVSVKPGSRARESTRAHVLGLEEMAWVSRGSHYYLTRQGFGSQKRTEVFVHE